MTNQFTLQNVTLNYTHSSPVQPTQGSVSPVVLLHGWGTNIQAMSVISESLKENFEVYTFDLPGFGASTEPPEAWDIYKYADFVETALNQLGIKNPILLGHSFGGRISIILASRMSISKLVLVDAAGIKPKRSFNYYQKVYTYKAIKKLAKTPIISRLFTTFVADYQKKSGSSDYQSASPIMKGVLSKVVNQDLRKHMPDIKASTLLIWGTNDFDTPVSDAKIMESLIPDSGLVTIKNAGHFSYLEQPTQFLTILHHFLGDAQ
jgi:pimeloyl-ACP methyl ester carboxylesterase